MHLSQVMRTLITLIKDKRYRAKVITSYLATRISLPENYS